MIVEICMSTVNMPIDDIFKAIKTSANLNVPPVVQTQFIDKK